MSDRGRPIVNPTLQLTAVADVSRRGGGRRRIEVTDARALRVLLAAATGGRRPRLDGAPARRLLHEGKPAPERRTAWPFWIAARPGRRAVRLGLGDGVLYRGTHLTHWRSAQPAGHSTVLACFHYGRVSSRA